MARKDEYSGPKPQYKDYLSEVKAKIAKKREKEEVAKARLNRLDDNDFMGHSGVKAGGDYTNLL